MFSVRMSIVLCIAGSILYACVYGIMPNTVRCYQCVYHS